jgi:endonuclease/exonuclease/phosphatase family metal-dependent hydrolase
VKKPKVTLSDLKPSTPGSDRYYRVDAVHGDDVVPSRTGRFTLKPATMSALKVDKVAADGVRLVWKPVANARQYDVDIARSKDFAGHVTSVRTLGSDARFVTTSLAAGTRYWLRVRPVNGASVAPFGKAVAVKTRQREAAFNVGTWNVCSEKCSGYASRARIMADFLDDNAIDIFALQEAGGKRVGVTTNAIFTGHSQGYVRATGGAKARYIFYRPALFTQKSGGYFPVGHGRHATWGRFVIKATGRQFFLVDVHLENGHGNDAKRASEMRVLLSRMRSINDSDLPIIYAGDFNSGRHRNRDSPGAMMRSAGLEDTVVVAKDPVNRQFNSGHTMGTGVPMSGAYVDHIFVSDEFSVVGWKQLVRLAGGRYARPVVTDHNALRATVALDAAHVTIGTPTPTTTVGGLSGQ